MAIPKEPCPKCGANIGLTLWGFAFGREPEAYCSNCGLKIGTKCPKCGVKLTFNERFCSRCGTKNPIFVEKS